MDQESKDYFDSLESEVATLGRGAYRISRREGVIVGIEVWPDVGNASLHVAVTEHGSRVDG